MMLTLTRASCKFLRKRLTSLLSGTGLSGAVGKRRKLPSRPQLSYCLLGKAVDPSQRGCAATSDPSLEKSGFRDSGSPSPVHPSKGTSGDGGEGRGVPRAGITEAARVDGRGARRERHFEFGNKKKT